MSAEWLGAIALVASTLITAAASIVVALINARKDDPRHRDDD